MSIEATHYPFGTVKEIFHRNEEGKLHSSEGAAYIKYHEITEKKVTEKFYMNGILFRQIEYHSDGYIFYEIYFNKEGNIHRENAPAYIEYRHGDNSKIIDNETWYQNGKKYRKDGPAEICYNDECEFEKWYTIPNQLHRDENEGPADIRYSKDENGGRITHKIYKCYNQFKGYSQIHRLSGPSSARYDKDDNIILGKWSVYYNIWGKEFEEVEYLRVIYQVRRFIRKLKARRRERLCNILRDTKIQLKNGIDILKSICVFMI